MPPPRLGLHVLLLLFFFFSFIQALPTSSGEEPDDTTEDINWQCGTDILTKYISEGQIEQDCPTLKVPINNCCLAHDACYDQQKGRQYCDDIFCACLQHATEPSKVCSEEDGPLFCTLVRELGDDAYINSAKNGTEDEEGSGAGMNETTLLTDIAPPPSTRIQAETSSPSDDYEGGGAYFARRLYDSVSSSKWAPAGGLLLHRVVRFFAENEEDSEWR